MRALNVILSIVISLAMFVLALEGGLRLIGMGLLAWAVIIALGVGVWITTAEVTP